MIKKNINFLCSDAHIESWMKFSQPTVSFTASAVAKLFGGHWVGGWCELTNDSIKIYANWANRAVMRDLKELIIRLEEITEVEIQKAFVTNIITIYFGNSLIKIRCFKATDFANLIKEHAKLN